jgi:Ca2+-binding RTX toxin-like protein
MIFIETDDHDYYFRNYHVVINDGVIINVFGYFSNEPSGTIQNNAGGTIAGSLENYGTTVNKCGGNFEAHVVYGDPVTHEPCTGTSPCDNPTIIGTDGNDIIDGTPGADVIIGKGGDDTINGVGGNDLICGGGGNDSISGGAGSDLVFGGHGNDVVNGGLGHDRLNGGAGNDLVAGNGGDDIMIGSTGNDTLNGKDGVDRNDFLDGGPGTDTCYTNLQDPTRNCEV